MLLEALRIHDLNEISHLQPEGWPDIIPEFEFYIRSAFCCPVKISADNRIVGVGTSIVFHRTAWLAHVIVDNDYRRRGIGSQMVEALIRQHRHQNIESFSLIATELGEPVYTRAGFRKVTDYRFFMREKPWKERPVSENITGYHGKYSRDILGIDRRISGENRKELIIDVMSNALLYLKQQAVVGYFLTGLREGPIYAENEEAGLELMKVKYSKADKAVLPSDNLAAIEFLKQNGFSETNTKGTRMILGKDLNWEPKKVFSRIGGNYG